MDNLLVGEMEGFSLFLTLAITNTSKLAIFLCFRKKKEYLGQYLGVFIVYVCILWH